MAAVGKAEPPGEGELAVEPRIQQRPAVDLDSHLTGALDGGLAAGFELESGGIGCGEPNTRNRGAASVTVGFIQAMSAPSRMT
jgi:hypothetical protein